MNNPKDLETTAPVIKEHHTFPFLGSARFVDAIKTAWSRVNWRKVGIFIVSLFLFTLAVVLMKEGARDLDSLVRDRFQVSNPANSLGFGWIFAYMVMSGSPVAAATLAFFDAGIIDQLGAFTMITGSRLGASFIVLFIGFLYVLRGRSKASSLSMGLLSLNVTGVTHLAALFVGIVLLAGGVLDGVRLGSGFLLNSVMEIIFDPITGLILLVFPSWTLFPLGLGIILGSFSLFDKCLPDMSLKKSQMGRMSRLVYRPWIMFLLGSVITIVSMSVSVSLSILVPLSQRGFVRRENVIPYIMGAGITTFVDTLLAAVLLGNQPAFTVVLVEMFSVAIVSVVILGLVYHPFERAMLHLTEWITKSNRNLAIFMVSIFVVPLTLLFIF